MDEWAEIWVFSGWDNAENSPLMQVMSAEGSLEPEIWVREHGVRLYPEAIYFFKDV